MGNFSGESLDFSRKSLIFPEKSLNFSGKTLNFSEKPPTSHAKWQWQGGVVRFSAAGDFQEKPFNLIWESLDFPKMSLNFQEKPLNLPKKPFNFAEK